MASNDDYLRQHQQTWAGFTRFLFCAIIGIAIILIGMALFLV